jgi:hypothetical protein
VRSLDLLIEDAPDVILSAEFAGMLEAIQRWPENRDEDDELLFDVAAKRLVKR